MTPAVDFLAVESAKPFIIDLGKYTFQGRLIIAGIVDEWLLVRNKFAGRIGELVFADQIHPTEIGGIDPEIVRRQVHQSFAKEIRLKTTGTTIGPDRCLVRQENGHVELKGRNTIGSHQKLG